MKEVLYFCASLSLFVILGSILSGCASESASVIVKCGTVVTYSPEFQRRAANEMQYLGDDDPLVILAHDYETMRDESRACGGK